MNLTDIICRKSWVFALVLCAGGLAGCSSLPNAGPTTDAVVTASPAEGSTSPVPAYDVILIDDFVAQTIERNQPAGLSGGFSRRAQGNPNTLGVGDLVSVSIYEASSGGLFGSGAIATGAGTKSVLLPPQQVDQSGRISIPFAGRIKAAGRTTAQVGADIQANLKSKAIDPQVLVTQTLNASNLVTVSGEVGQGGRFPLSLKGDHILDAIAAAGGPRKPAHDVYVRLTRGSQSGIVRLSTLVAQPGENMSIQAGDEIFLYYKPQTFTVLGATGRNATIEFDQDRLSMIEALGKAGGLNDNRADATGVFLFRYENAKIYDQIHHLPVASAASRQSVPVVYHLNLRDPNSLLLAQRVTMRDKDVLYISNAPASDLQKVLALIGAGAGIVTSGATSAAYVK